MIELIERHTGGPGMRNVPKWMLYVGKEDLVILKELKLNKFENTKASYFNSKGRLIGKHYIGSYSNLKRVVGKYRVDRIIACKPEGKEVTSI